jgi:hypothetical protein
MLANVLKNDEYLRAISLRKNRIGEEGVKELLNASKMNHKLVQVDVT